MRYILFAALLACLCFPDLATAELSWQRETDFDQMFFQDVRAGKERLMLKAYGPLTEPGIILTVAGTGEQGFGGDGGPAIEALLNTPAGLAVADLTGNLFIADALNHRVRMVDPQGIITTVAGMGEGGSSGNGIPAIEANLAFPRGIAVDAAFGELFIADLGHQRIRKVDLSGLITTVAGAGGEGFSGDGGPATKARISVVQDIAVDEVTGNLFIADLLNHRVRMVVDAAAAISTEVTAVEELAQALPQQTTLHPNFPNPFNAQTTIDYQLAAPAVVQLTVYNLAGQPIKHLARGDQQAGFYHVSWDGTDDLGKPVGSGVYFYSLSAGGYQQTRRLVLLK